MMLMERVFVMLVSVMLIVACFVVSFGSVLSSHIEQDAMSLTRYLKRVLC